MSSERDILHLLTTHTGCRQLVSSIVEYLKRNRWLAVEHATEALDEDTLLIPIFSTVYKAKPNGNFWIIENSVFTKLP